MSDCNDVAAVSCIATIYHQTTVGVDRVSRARHQSIRTDAGEFDYNPRFPSHSSAQTSFHSNQADDKDKYDRLWIYQHGRGQTPDGHGRKTTPKDATARLAKTILCQCEVVEWARSTSVRRVMRENLNAFSRHYCGAEGACIGFALLKMYDTAEEASDSSYANRASEVIPELDDEDIVNLVDFIFRKYGGDS